MRRKLVESRSDARRAIDDGLVRVNANADPKPSTLVSPQDDVHLASPPARFVGRAGLKLDAALDAFPVTVENRRAIDVGASTGGFTDCLIQRGVTDVVALDVGYGQIHWKIRNHLAVTVIERMNIRYANVTEIGGPFDVIVADLSFISLRTVARALSSLGGEDSDWLLLIKPQFEAGRENVGKGGIVRDPDVRYDVIHDVLDHFANVGLGCRGLITSPITGATGNVEYVAWFRRGVGTVEDQEVTAMTKAPDA